MSRPGFTYPSCFATIKYHALRCGRIEREVYDVLDQIRFTFQYDPKFAQMDKDLKRYNTDLNMRNYFGLSLLPGIELERSVLILNDSPRTRWSVSSMGRLGGYFIGTIPGLL